VERPTAVIIDLIHAARDAAGIDPFMNSAAEALSKWSDGAEVHITYRCGGTEAFTIAGTAGSGGFQENRLWEDASGRLQVDVKIDSAVTIPATPDLDKVLEAVGVLALLLDKRNIVREAASGPRAAINASPLPAAHVRSSGELVQANERFAALFDVGSEGLAWHQLASLPFAFGDGILEQALDVVGRGECWTGRVTMTRLGQRQIYDLYLDQLTPGGGDDLILVLLDRTDELWAQRDTIAREKRLTAAGLADSVAHEVNNPLAAVRMEAELILSRTDDEEIANSANVIKREVDRAARVARALLNLGSRSDGHVSTVQVNDLIRDTVERRRESGRLGDIEYRMRLDPDLPTIVSAAGDLQNVFANLITNAEEALEGRSTRVIEVQSESSRHGVRVSISDSGPGIPEDIRIRVFDPFFTTKNPAGGAGLGLAVSHAVVAEAGGRLWFEDGLLHGARAVVELPLQGNQSGPGQRLP
jgi:signal transduction histidine kinase